MDSKLLSLTSCKSPHKPPPSQERPVFMVKKEVKRLLEEGRKSFNEGEVERAIGLYQKALQVDSNCALTYFNLGYVYHEEGRYEHARDCYLKAMTLEPACSLFLEHLARLNFETFDYQEAIKLFQRASLVGPIQPLSLGLWGRALYESGLYEEAITAFESLLERENQPAIQVGARFWLVVSNLKLTRIAQARRVAEEILAAPEIDPKVLLDLGEHFLRVRCLSLAQAVFDRLVVDHEELMIARRRLEDVRNLTRKINELLPNLFEGDEERILHHCAGLRHFGSEKISRALASLLGSSSPLIREAVLEYQTNYGFDVVDRAVPLLHDPVAFVRHKAAIYFDRLDNPEHLPLMVGLLEDELPEIRAVAAGYLARHGTMQHLPKLELALVGPNSSDSRIAIREAINRIKRRHQEHLVALAHMTVALEQEEPEESDPFWRSKIVRAVAASGLLYLIYKLLSPLIF